MAACGADASRISNRSAGDAACEGGIVGDDGEDGPQGCVWACPAAADGMVPAGARQIDCIAGDPSAAGRAQAASRKVAGCGTEGMRKTFEARIWELVAGQATLGRIVLRRCFRRAQLCRRSTRNCTRLCSRLFVKTRLPTADDGAGRWSCGSGYLQVGGGRSEPHHEVEVGALFGLTPKKYQSGEKD